MLFRVMLRDAGNKEEGMRPGFPEQERTKSENGFTPEIGVRDT